MKALILDFGGVLTNNFWDVLRTYARLDGLPEDALIDLITNDAHGRRLYHQLERGEIRQEEFEDRIAERLGVAPRNLLARMAAPLRPDNRMLSAVEHLRDRGITIAILSNSWGSGYLDPYRDWNLDHLADVVVLSDKLRLRKPEPEIFMHCLRTLDLPASECIFVDDIASNLEAAKHIGLHVWHHVDARGTIAQLGRCFPEKATR